MSSSSNGARFGGNKHTVVQVKIIRDYNYLNLRSERNEDTINRQLACSTPSPPIHHSSISSLEYQQRGEGMLAEAD